MSHRNEPARERRRRDLKQRGSLSSLPLDESKRRQLTLENHFGWTVMQKCQVGDGGIPRYPQVVQYHEKPEVVGPDYQKVTYVLYLKGKEDNLGRKEKEVQTSPRKVTTAEETTEHPQHKVVEEKEEKREKVVKEEKPPKEEKKKKKEEKKKVEKKEEKPRDKSPSGAKKLIYDFYYKKRDRSASGDRIFRPIESQTYLSPEENPVVVENYTTDYVPPGNKKPKTEKGRSKPKSWQLRSEAGSDFTGHQVGEQESDSEETIEIDPKCKRSTSKEVLWESPSRTNEFLYMPSRVTRTSERNRG